MGKCYTFKGQHLENEVIPCFSSRINILLLKVTSMTIYTTGSSRVRAKGIGSNLESGLLSVTFLSKKGLLPVNGSHHNNPKYNNSYNSFIGRSGVICFWLFPFVVDPP